MKDEVAIFNPMTKIFSLEGRKLHHIRINGSANPTKIAKQEVDFVLVLTVKSSGCFETDEYS